MSLPLEGLRVLDLTRLLPGGFCSLLLADLGADVIKVEDTGMGDYVRWAPPYYGDEDQHALGTRSALYLSLNRGKRSIRLDLKQDAGRQALLRLGGGGLMAAVGVLAALRERDRSGEGQLVDISMADGGLSWLAMAAAAYLCDGRVPQRGAEQLTGGFVCYCPYEAADGWVTCGALESKFWRRFCEATGHPELIDKQFERPGSEAWRQVANVFRSRTRAEWRAFNDEHDAMIEPVLDLDQ